MIVNRTMTTSVAGYINRIRNPQKREYANEYWDWLLMGRRADMEPEYHVSYMAAQSVRMAIDTIVNHTA